MKPNLLSKALTALSAVLLVTSLTACSSSPSDAEGGDDLAAMGDEIPDLEAGTDAVPEGGLEQIENIEGLPEGSLAKEDAPASEAPAEPVAQADAMPPSEGLADPMAAPLAEPAADPLASAPPAEPAPDAMAAAPAPEAPASDAPPADAGTFSGGSGAYETYSVQRGDTLMKIAFETYGDLYQWRRIYDLNQDRLQDPNNLPPGVALKLERSSSPVSIDRNGERYLIKVGDTLGTISDDVYGTPAKWRKLWENNRQLIKDPNRIFAGFHLYYTITPEEQEEADRIRQQRQVAPPPLATGDQPEDRGPASATAPSESATPGT